MRIVFAVIALLMVTTTASAVGLADITNRDAVSGLRQALTDGSAAAIAKLGLVDASQETIEQHVTKKALDGLYQIIAEEEKAIRQDPIGAASGIAQEVFGALK